MVPSLYDVYITPKTALFRLLAGLLIAAGGVTALAKARRPVRITTIDLLLAGMIAWLGLAALFSPSPLVSLLGMRPRFEGWLGIVGYAVFYWYASRSRPLFARWTGAGLALVAAVIGALAFLEMAGVMELLGSGTLGHRALTTLGNPVYVGSFMALAIPVTVAWMAGASTLDRTLVWGLALGLQIGGLSLAVARAGIIGAAAGTLVLLGGLVLARAWPRVHLRHVMAGLAVAAAMGALIPLAADQIAGTGSKSQAETSVDATGTGAAAISGGSAEVRLLMWEGTARLVAQRPLLGWGPDTFAAEYPRVRPLRQVKIEPSTVYPDRPHNQWLYVAYAGGLPALALQLMFLAALLWRAVAALRRTKDPARALTVAALMGAMVAGAVDTSFSFSTPFITPWSAMLQGFLFAMTGTPRTGRFQADLASRLPRPGQWRGPVRVGAGAVLVLLSLPFFIEAVRLPMADHAYMSALHEGNSVVALQRAVRLAPRDQTYALSLVEAYDQGGDRKAALAAGQSALGRLPWDAGLAYTRAAMLMLSGESSTAERGFRVILARDPYNGPARIGLGRVLIETGRAPEAIDLLTVATTFVDNDPRAWYALGVAYEESDDKRAAAEAYRRVLQLTPSDAAAAEGLQRVR